MIHRAVLSITGLTFIIDNMYISEKVEGTVFFSSGGENEQQTGVAFMFKDDSFWVNKFAAFP